MKNLPFLITLASIFVVFIIDWLVTYTEKYMLKLRSRELGTYILLSIEKSKVATMFLVENICIGLIAFLFGLLCGNFIYQGLYAIILNLFDVPYTFQFSFSIFSLGLTFLYVVGIYLFSYITSKKQINKMKIYDLIYFDKMDKMNEPQTISNNKKRKLLFVFPIIVGFIGTLLLVTRVMWLALLGAAFIIFFMSSFFISFTADVTAYFNKKPTKKYSGMQLPIFRMLSSKISSMGITMSIISLLITATLISMGSRLIFNNLFTHRTELSTSFDIFIGSSNKKEDFVEYYDYINSNFDIKESYTYQAYQADNSNITNYLLENTNYIAGFDYDVLLSYSDYSALREILGYPAVPLEKSKYIIHCNE